VELFNVKPGGTYSNA